MTRPLGARTRHGWLTSHALASGLREQFAHRVGSEVRQVQLYCTPRPTRSYTVEYTVNGTIEQTHPFTDLPLAQARYVALVHKAKRPAREEQRA